MKQIGKYTHRLVLKQEKLQNLRLKEQIELKCIRQSYNKNKREIRKKEDYSYTNLAKFPDLKEIGTTSIIVRTPGGAFIATGILFTTIATVP